VATKKKRRQRDPGIGSVAAGTVMLVVRTEASLLRRLDEEAARLKRKVKGAKIHRSDIVRIFLDEGLERAEKAYQEERQEIIRAAGA
jgi:hypothetical protein